VRGAAAFRPVLGKVPVLVAALLIDAAIGYPPALYRRIRHPVVWIGALIAMLDARLNGRFACDRAAGALAVLIVVLAAALPAWIIQRALQALPGGWIFVALLVASLLAQRSLFVHVAAVGEALAREGLAGGRRAVSHIVGRDPERLDAHGVARAAIESLAENFSDGVVAPAFWCALFGLPGIAVYKALNTADSMIGHRTPRHAQFGWAAARLDDLANLPASRLAAFWIALASPRPLASLRTAWRDARHHRSPNAGWPEAAMAAALGLALAGPRVYAGARVDDAWMGEGRAEATAADIARALALYRRACALQILAVALLALSARG
jgi:adenosylcobinamide-phosphate synthase